MKMMAGLLRHSRYADEVMGLLAQEDAALYTNVGRNDPCPCGSGRKFKRCHGDAHTDRHRARESAENSDSFAARTRTRRAKRKSDSHG
jgi:hypothetical protein